MKTDLLEFDDDMFGEFLNADEIKPPAESDKPKEPPKVEVKKRKLNKLLLNRVASEKALDDKLDWHFENGDEYHCISQGDVDSLSYLRFIVKQQKLKYCMISTWVMAEADIAELDDWLTRGFIEKLDVWVGEIFYKSVAYQQLEEVLRKHGGRIYVFRNHSKVMVGYGERFDFVIESSANVNTNPRTEQTTIIVDSELADFYKEYYTNITPFNKW